MVDIGSRIQQARKMRSLSLRELGDRADLSAQAISKYERGLDTPGSGALLRLSRALDVSIEFFLRPRRVLEIRPDYRKRSSFPRKLEVSLQATILDWLDRYLEAEELRSPDGLEFVYPEGFPREVASPGEIERAALDLREAWKLGWDPIENLTELLEDRGIRVGSVESEERFDACTFLAEADGKKLPVVVARRGGPGDRQRFSLAHELGHLMIRATREDEAEAAMNRFAGAFLAPEPAARFELGGPRRHLDLYELHLLKHKYGLSMQGWIYRAKDVGLLSDSRAASLFRTFRIRGWHRQEPGDAVPAEHPTRFERLVVQALAEDLISEGRAAELLGKPLQRFLSEVSKEHDGLPVAVRDGYERLD